MKFIIIGLGNFGSSLAIKLTHLGHEVIGVDKQIGKVENIKDLITNAICMDCRHQDAVKNLPLKNTDAVIVCIGEDEGANLLTTALLKNMKVPRLISRSLSPIHETILDSMGINEIVRPEEEAAERWAMKLTTNGVIDTFELNDNYSIMNVSVPKHFVGKTIKEIGFSENYNLVVLSIIKNENEKKFLGIFKKTSKFQIQGIAKAETILDEDDILILYGHNDNIHNLLKI